MTNNNIQEQLDDLTKEIAEKLYERDKLEIINTMKTKLNDTINEAFNNYKLIKPFKIGACEKEKVEDFIQFTKNIYEEYEHIKFNNKI
jgi:hypothetical protein